MKNLKERISSVKFIKLIYNISFSSLWNRIFNRLNLSKVLVIFVVGFVSRVLVNYLWGVNVFVDYLNCISIGYYGFMAIFVVLVNEIFSYIDLKSFPMISIKDVFSISSIRKAISGIISNIGNKGKVSLSGDLGDKVLEKSDKVSGVLLMGDNDAISSGVSEKDEGKLGVKDKGKLGVKDKFSDSGSDISSNSRRVPFVLGDECVDDVFEGKNVRSNPRDNHEFKRRKRSSSLYSGNYSIHSEGSIDPRIPRWGPGAPKISRLSTPSTMSPLFPPSEVNSFNSPHNSPRPSYISMSPHNSARPSYSSITTEEFRDVVIRGIQKDIRGSIEEKLKVMPANLNEEKDFSKPNRINSDPLKTSPRKEFIKPSRINSDPLKTSPKKSISDSLKTSPKKVVNKLKDFVDGGGYVESVSPPRYNVGRTSAGVKGLYGLDESKSDKNSPEYRSSKKGGYYKKR
jgi:hypothetical protein